MSLSQARVTEWKCSSAQDLLDNDPLFTIDECQSELWSEKNALTLIGVILTDSFEENKGMATKIFAFFPTSTLDLNVCVAYFFLSILFFFLFSFTSLVMFGLVEMILCHMMCL